MSREDTVGPKGAGAILYSSLVTNGWRFPTPSLSEEDERLLFDLEVRLKLKHDQSIQQLRDVLVDFPSSVLLNRLGLLHVLFDILSSPYSFTDLEQSPSSFHPVIALELLQSLWERSLQELQMYLDGGLVSVVSAEDVSDMPVIIVFYFLLLMIF